MPIPRDFLQTADGDLDFSEGLRFTPDLATYVQQCLRVNLSTFLGEWFLDTRLGLPFFRVTAGRRFDPALVDAMYRQAVQKTNGVASVDAVELDFDRTRRVLAVNIACTAADGSAVAFPLPLVIDLA